MILNDSSRPALLAFAPLLDGMLIALAGWVAYALRWDSWFLPQDYLFTLLLGTMLTVFLLPVTGAYQSWQGRTHWHSLGHALPGLIAVSLFLVVLGTLTKTTSDFSRLWMGYWFLLVLLSMFVLRLVVGKLQRLRLGRESSTRQVLIVGDGDFAASVAQKICAAPESSLVVCGLVTTGDPEIARDFPAPVVGSVEQLEEIVSANDQKFDEVWIAVSDFSSVFRDSVVQILRTSCLTVRFVPNLSMLAMANHMPIEVAGMTVIDLNASPLQGHNALLKIAFDKLFACIALLILAPLLCLIALLIKLDSRGPVFFLQQRLGWGGQVIKVIKFRTMTHINPLADSGQQAVRNDPRVTNVGRILRRVSLDELPQFINVVKGDMSVVGPRPHPLALNEDYFQRIDAYMQRHRVRPGITGWAQVNGLRGQTDTVEKMQKRVEYDLYYIDHWSLWLDWKIILRTITVAWKGENAY